MKLIIHRGNKEVGASCIEIRSGSGASIFIDAGLELYGEKAKLPKEIENTDAIFLSMHIRITSDCLAEFPKIFQCIAAKLRKIFCK